MLPIDFGAYALWQNLAVFLFAAAIIWAAGSRLAIYADIIADRSGLGQALVGLVLLAGTTSLPEIGRTISAATIGNSALVVDSLFGGIVLQTAILALADMAVAQQVLTFFAPSSVLLLEGAVVVLLLGLALSGIASGELFSVFEVGAWSILLLAAYVLAIYLLQCHEGRGWVPIEVPEQLKREEEEKPGEHRLKSSLEIGLRFAASSTVIFLAGMTLAQVGDVLAVQTGLGASIVGATLLAFASALPEMSTTIAAVRLGAYSMAISNIFGTNALLVALVFVGDLFYRQGPILESVGRSSLFAASMGIVTTSVLLVGLIERRNKTYFGMGLDSIAVLILYLLTLFVLFLLR
ncbi:MAG: sodium:calcium antiporter [Chloroflexota bacterium]|jgi:cation:H+ antiporter